MTDRAANELGSFMLKGWVLTDRTCPTAGCKWPLLRSPKDNSHFCANCDGNPEGTTYSSSIAPHTPSTSGSSGSHISRLSTPPTDVSRSMDSPTFELPPESEASARRREQSDRASAEIGTRLLRGWAMLAEECPSNDCFGVPLVRPPNPSPGSKDPRMECVICGRVYLSETDSGGAVRLVPYSPNPKPHLIAPQPSSAPNPPSTIATQQPPTWAEDSISGSEPYLNTSVKALESSLMLLSQRLSVVQADPLAVGLTADAITKTVQALTMVKQLQWSELQNSLGRP